jgi:CubicO group peptidase (beta-lactamase class C family)
MRRRQGPWVDAALARLGRRCHPFITAVALLSACAPRVANGTQDSKEIIGSWIGGQVLEFDRRDSQVVLFSMRPDSSLYISMIYEVGPRARLWTYDIDVTYRYGRVSWAFHEGHLNPGRDTMWVSKDYRGDKSEWLYVRDRGADSLMEHLRSQETSSYEYQIPRGTDDGWECGEPAGVGLEKETLSRFLEGVSNGEFGDIHSVLIARHNTLAVEEYFAEQGTKHGPFISSVFGDRVHHLASVTKSLTSVLVGIAINRGFITSVQDPIARYLPAYTSLLGGEKESITIEHLLTMSSGLDWEQSGIEWSNPRNDAAAMWRCEDVVQYVLQKPIVVKPGERFVYSNGSAAVVGAILRNAAGMEVGRFAEEHLFRPLGITEFLWTSYPDGTVETDGGLALRPRDLAKIGQTLLDHGRWHDVPVVPKDWVVQSTEQRFAFGSVGETPLGYGYFWMQAELPTADGMVRSFFHPGDGGQFLMVIPDLEMIVVLTGGTYGANVNRNYLAILMEHILPAVDPEFER